MSQEFIQYLQENVNMPVGAAILSTDPLNDLRDKAFVSLQELSTEDRTSALDGIADALTDFLPKKDELLLSYNKEHKNDKEVEAFCKEQAAVLTAFCAETCDLFVTDFKDRKNAARILNVLWEEQRKLGSLKSLSSTEMDALKEKAGTLASQAEIFGAARAIDAEVEALNLSENDAKTLKELKLQKAEIDLTLKTMNTNYSKGFYVVGILCLLMFGLGGSILVRGSGSKIVAVVALVVGLAEAVIVYMMYCNTKAVRKEWMAYKKQADELEEKIGKYM